MTAKALGITFVLAAVWEVFGDLALPDANLAYASGVAVFWASIIVPGLIVGITARVLGWPYDRVDRWSLMVGGVAGCVLVKLVQAIVVFATTPPDGQDSMLIAYVFVVYPVLVFPVAWVVRIAADSVPPRGRP